MADSATISRHELEAKIVRRSWENEEFREEFIRDPKAAFVKYLGVPASSLPEMVVHQEQPGTWHIVLPARPAGSAELSDAELEKFAGGTTPFSALAMAATVAIPVFYSATYTSGDGGW